MKHCKGCGEQKPMENFYEHAMMADGRLNYCKDCVKNRVARRRNENIEMVRAYDRERGRSPARLAKAREYGRRNPDRSREFAAGWKARNPEKRSAQIAVGNAVRDGRLVKQPCFCGDAVVEGHHPDYSKPLDVVWLCDKHHKEEHRMLRGKPSLASIIASSNASIR